MNGWRRGILGNSEDRLPDCTQPTPVEDLPDEVITLDSAARHVFGCTYGNLARSDQRKVDMIMNGRRKELEERLSVLKVLNSLSAHERLDRMGKIEEDALRIMEMLAADAAELMTEGDNMVVTKDKDGFFVKTPAGTKRRNLRHGKAFMAVRKLYVDTTIAKAKLSEQKQPATFVKEGNKTVNITGDVVKDRLGKFSKGGVIDQSGDVDDSGQSADD